MSAVVARDPVRSAWLAERKTVLTSTDMAAVCGVSAWGTPLHVYRDKTTEEDVEFAPRWVMRAGLLLEPLVHEMYEDATGRPLAVCNPYKLYRNPELPYLGCSRDRDGGDRLVEMKTVMGWDGWGEEGTDEAKPEYVVQAQTQMLVTGADLCEIVALHRGTMELRVYPVRRHQGMADALAAAAERFWKGHVEARQPPDPDYAHPATVALLNAVRPVPGLETTLGWNAGGVMAVYQAASNDEARARDVKQQAKAQLLHLLGPAAVGRLPDGREVKRKVIPVKEHVVKAHDQVRLFLPK